jgi:putative membrane protein
MHSPLGRAIIHLLLSGLSVFIVAKLLPGVRAKSFLSAVIFAAVVGLFNAIVWGALGPLSKTISVVTLGIGALVINGLVFLGAARLVKGVEISGCFMAAIASLGVGLVNWGLHAMLGGWAR